MLELGVKFLISYFIGSLMGAMIMGKLRGGVDIRTMGSGNAGGTNALRTQGIVFALGVVIVDIGKGVIGAGLVPGLVPGDGGAHLGERKGGDLAVALRGADRLDGGHRHFDHAAMFDRVKMLSAQ